MPKHATKLADLTADPHNVRVHPTRNVAMMAASLREVGAARSIVIDERNTILAGNGIAAAAGQAGITRVRIVEAAGDELIAVRRRNLSAAQKQQLAIYDNRTAELAEWNLAELQALDGVIDLAPWFTATELATLMGAKVRGGKTDPDAVPPMRATDIKPGDLFALGDHRLLCGDSAAAADVARLIDGHAADLLLSSPPYNVGMGYSTHDDRPVAGDAYFGWLEQLLGCWRPMIASGRALVWNVGVAPHTCPYRHGMMLERLGLTFLRQFVWQKVGVPLPTWHNTRDDPRVRRLSSNYTHELVYVFATGELVVGAPQPADPTLEHDVFRVHQADATADIPSGEQRTGVKSNLDRRSFKAHPAAFPVALPQAFITHYTAPEEIVLEPFAGAGSTMIACERLGRRSFGMEIDPQYCQVAIDRWEAFTGKKATKDGAAPAATTRKRSRRTTRESQQSRRNDTGD